VIARLSNLELKARLVVEGFMTGLHKSPYHGFSVEFAEHRQYLPGDDLKYLDWKIYGRTDKFFIKQYEEETNLKSYVVLDISKSMSYSSEPESLGIKSTFKGFFGKKKKDEKKSLSASTSPETVKQKETAGVSKLEYASYLAASLSYMMLLQNDSISLTTYDTKIQRYIPPHSTNTNLRLILKELAGAKSVNETGTAKCLNEVAEKIKRRGLVIVISDFFDNPQEVINALKHFRYNKNEVIIFQVLDPVEYTFLQGNPVTLVDMETGEEMYSQPFAVQKAYKEAMAEFLDVYKTGCRKNNIDYVLINTQTPFDKALLGYLNKRKRML
jgi:Uncharacterized conserved protein (some members contain a von Willebrand factor type A (vWA) domain)